MVLIATSCRDSWESPRGTDWVQIATAWHSATCGLHADGTTECWGSHVRRGMTPPEDPVLMIDVGGVPCGLTDAGSLVCGAVIREGDNHEPNILQLTLHEPYQDLAVGGGFYCGLASGGVAYCSAESWIDLPSPDDEEHYSQISAGEGYFCGLRQDGSASCLDTEGTPEDATGPFSVVEAGDDGACGITDSGSLDCWGIPFFVGARGPFSSVSIGLDTLCALDLDGEMYCWWDEDSDVIVAEPPPGPFVQIAVGTNQMCGLTAEGKIVCARITVVEE